MTHHRQTHPDTEREKSRRQKIRDLHDTIERQNKLILEIQAERDIERERADRAEARHERAVEKNMRLELEIAKLENKRDAAMENREDQPSFPPFSGNLTGMVLDDFDPRNEFDEFIEKHRRGET